jgi:hypothetical protein
MRIIQEQNMRHRVSHLHIRVRSPRCWPQEVGNRRSATLEPRKALTVLMTRHPRLSKTAATPPFEGFPANVDFHSIKNTEIHASRLRQVERERRTYRSICG